MKKAIKTLALLLCAAAMMTSYSCHSNGNKLAQFEKKPNPSFPTRSGSMNILYGGNSLMTRTRNSAASTIASIWITEVPSLSATVCL